MGSFITSCAKAGIHISNIHRIDGITLKLCVYNYQFDELCGIITRLGGKYKIEYQKGLMQKLGIIKSRKFFAAGFLLFLLCIILNASFVSSITVVGNETVAEDTILSLLEEKGFKKGVLIYNIDKKQIQQDILKSYDKLAWLWIHLEGTKATVTVKERTPVPDMRDAGDYSNCVASSDGVIIEIMPRYGRQIVRPGDVVKKGDLLISGMSETLTGEIRYLHADGIVMAKTWYTAQGEYHHTRCDRYLTGRTKKLYNLNVGNHSMPIGTDKIGFEKYDVSEECKKIVPFLNLSFTIYTYCEIIEENVTISDKEVADTAAAYLEQRLKADLADKASLEINDIATEWSVNSRGNIDVRVTFECSEDIAQYQPLYKPEILLEEHDGENSTV